MSPAANPIREAPASALMNFLDDNCHKSDRPADEPVLCIDNIQGNSLAGFSKDHQRLVFLRITDAAAFKDWLATQVSHTATVAEVLAFNRLFKALRFRRKYEGTIKATWFNIAFTAEGLRELLPAGDVDDPQHGFTDAAFKAGLHDRSASLGDPQDATMEGAPTSWLFGGSKDTEPHAVLICQSDDEDDLFNLLERVRSSIYGLSVSGAQPKRSGAVIVYEQIGATLPQPLTGHEHFGFLDGVSQPGVRGRVSDNPDDLLTLRQNANDRSQGKPGQDCLYPGEFVFGYPRQNPADADAPGPVAKARGGVDPDWTDDGNFYVVRRLRQNVAELHKWVRETAAANGVSVEALGAALVGRHENGTPVVAPPNDDSGGDDCRNNWFDFNTAPKSGAPPDDCGCDLTGAAPAPVDPNGDRCPFSGHIRKAYPRDDLNEADVERHRLLRRGIPFGVPYSGSPDDDGDRGLVFAAYQTSIVDQFEFVTAAWVNGTEFLKPATGPDPILGQSSTADRKRTITTSVADGAGGTKKLTLTIPADFVIPTGGGYFFAPSIDALWMLAGKNQPPVCKAKHQGTPPPAPQPPPKQPGW